MATHSSVLAWRIPGTGEPGGLPSIRSHRVGHKWSDLAAAVFLKIYEPQSCCRACLYHIPIRIVEYTPTFLCNQMYVFVCVCVCVCVCAQSCPTLCGPMDCSVPGSAILGIFQARILEWVVIPYARDFLNPGIEAASLVSPALEDGFFATNTTWETQCNQKKKKFYCYTHRKWKL